LAFTRLHEIITKKIESVIVNAVRTPNLKHTFLTVFMFVSKTFVGHAVAYLVETLRYEPEGHGFDFR
jgi:hypothetical protein